MKIPTVVIAGTNSGCGKTTVSMGLMAALVNRGMTVQPFKVGPDYIDPMFHTFITGRNSRNLDSWLLEEKTIKYLYVKNAENCDIAIVEGVMGFYDGLGGTSIEGSTAHVSKILKCPVVLVINAEGMSLSAAAMVKGFLDFEEGVNIKAVILNRVKSYGLYLLLKDIIEDNTGIKVLGYIPESDDCKLPERKLGLVFERDDPDLKNKLEKLGTIVEKNVDLDMLLRISDEVEDIEKVEMDIPNILIGSFNETQKTKETGDTREITETGGVSKTKEIEGKELSYEKLAYKTGIARIAVASDRAFSFYYKDNLDLLEMLGGKLVYFSPLEDKVLPHGVDGVYFGGGYPELFASELSQNLSMRHDVRNKLLNGLPAYAEGGGFMYLGKAIKNIKGDIYDMAGVLPTWCEMTSSLQRFGYINIEFLKDCILGKSGCKTRAHEFHYSVMKNEPYELYQPYFTECFEVYKYRRRGESVRWKDGVKVKNTLGTYSHIHFWSNPRMAIRFIETCFKYKETMRYKETIK